MPDTFEVPAPTPQAEAVYRKFMASITSADIMLAMQLQLSAAHWCDSESLYICFDKTKRSSYNYAQEPEVHSRLRRAAAQSIAPMTVELVLKDGSVRVSDKIPEEIYGVKITEE